MKAKPLQIPLSLALLFALVPNAFPQGTFRNLDFEAAMVNDLPPGVGEVISMTNGVPGWAVSPTAGLDLMGHNTQPLSGAGVSILGPQWPSSQILQGSYTIELFASVSGPPSSAAIFQTAQIPADAKSIRFYGLGSFTVSFAGQQVAFAPIGSGPNYNIFGADISILAGQTGQLLFIGDGLLDNISFSNQQVPESAVSGLLALGAVALGLSRRTRRR